MKLIEYFKEEPLAIEILYIIFIVCLIYEFILIFMDKQLNLSMSTLMLFIIFAVTVHNLKNQVGDLMNRTEMIFMIAVTAILLICVATMPQYFFIFVFLLALALIVIAMSLLAKYRQKYENRKLSLIFCILAVILFIIYFVNSVYLDFTNKGSTGDSLLLLALFIISICLGWFFEKND